MTKRTRLCPRRRAAEHQQLSDGGRKDVAAAGAMLRGATRGAGAGGMNTTIDLIGGCLSRSTQIPMTDDLARIRSYFLPKKVPVKVPVNG